MTVRILACSGSLDGGGSERQLVQFVRQLHGRPYDVQVYLQYRRGIHLASLPSDVRVHDYWSSHGPRWTYPGRIRRLQIDHLADVLATEKIDVVYDRTYHMTLVTAPACQRIGCPRISVITSPPSRDLGARRERFRSWKRRLLARYYAAPGAWTIAVSQQVADDAANYYGLDRQRLLVLPNAVDARAIADQAAQGAMEDSSPHAWGDFWLVVGRMTPEKGQADAVRAFAQYNQRHSPYRPWSLVLMGDGPQRPYLERLVRDLGIAHRVHFLGVQSNPFPWIQAARGLVVPSHYEGLPNVVLEALALGTPVLATRCSPDVEALLAQDRGHLVDVGAIEDMAAALARLQSSPKPAAEQRLARQRYVQQRFGIDAWTETMRNLVLQASEARSSAPAWRREES
ncbi:MAG: glycosyltransferase [Planctomycetota bacterium]|nr:MAG: glycosyltransferase [Planctomycetota bacterium]